MRLAEEYVRLRVSWHERSEEDPFHVTMAEIAEVLCCTPRNARFIIARLVKADWIQFVSGRGRGHTSVLTFCQSLVQIAVEEARERVQQGDVADALAWVRQPGLPEQVEPIFISWLGQYFGYTRGEQTDAVFTDTLRLPIYRPVVCLDPAEAEFAFDTQLIYQLYSRLVEYRAEERKLLPGIAHHWKCSPDGKCWSFYLYKHVRFHNERLLTADDVVASLRRLQKGNHTHSWLLSHVDEIASEHPYTVVITLTKPNLWLPILLAHSGASIIPDGVCQEQSLPIGTGSYRLSERTTGRCVLERFDAYYGQGAIIDRIEIIIVPQQEVPAALGGGKGVLTVLTGEFDTSTFAHLPRQNITTGVSMLMLNRKHGMLSEDEALRQALYYGIDRVAMSDALGDTYTVPAHGFVLTAPMPYGSESSSDDPYADHAAFSTDRDYLPQYAKEQLYSSRYDGRELQLYTFQRHAQTAYWLRDAYADIGITLAIHIVTWAELISDELLASADMLLFEAVLGGGLHRQLEYMQSSQSVIRRMLPESLIADLQPLTDRMLLTSWTVEPAGELADVSVPAHEWLNVVNSLLHDTFSSVFLTERIAGIVSHRSLRGIHPNERGWVDFGRLYVTGSEEGNDSEDQR